jgi:hypothetical protein
MTTLLLHRPEAVGMSHAGHGAKRREPLAGSARAPCFADFVRELAASVGARCISVLAHEFGETTDTVRAIGTLEWHDGRDNG